MAPKRKSQAQKKKERSKVRKECMTKSVGKGLQASVDHVKDALIAWMENHPKAAAHVLLQVNLGVFDEFEKTDTPQTLVQGETFQNHVNKFRLLPQDFSKEMLTTLLPNLKSWIKKVHKKNARWEFSSMIAFMCNVAPSCALPSKKEYIMKSFIIKAWETNDKRLSTIRLQPQDSFEDLRSM